MARPYFNFTNALFFFALALLLNVYVTLVFHQSCVSSVAKAPEAILMDIPLSHDRIDKDDPADDDYETDEPAAHISGTEYAAQESYLRSSNLTSTVPSLAIVSVCIPGERFTKEYIRVSRTNKRHYCQRHGAKCILPTESVQKNSTLHTKWNKLHYINQTLYTEAVEWVLWMDCDAAFTNFEINWQTQLKYHLKPSKLMIVSKDQGGINMGVFLVPNTHLSRKFIEKLYKLRHLLDKKYFHKDQAALRYLMEKNPQLESRIEIVNQNLINTYIDNDAGEKWKPYDFIVHQVFCWELDGCLANFTRLVKIVTPQYYPVEEEVDEVKKVAKHEKHEGESGSGFFQILSDWWNGGTRNDRI